MHDFIIKIMMIYCDQNLAIIMRGVHVVIVSTCILAACHLHLLTVLVDWVQQNEGVVTII